MLSPWLLIEASASLQSLRIHECDRDELAKELDNPLIPIPSTRIVTASVHTTITYSIVQTSFPSPNLQATSNISYRRKHMHSCVFKCNKRKTASWVVRTD